MIELPEAARRAHEIAKRVRLPERRHERSDARHAWHRPVRARRGAGARPARASQHRRSRCGGAAAAAIPLEVCGEAASDPLTVPLLVGLGADELSVGAARVGTVRAWIRSSIYEGTRDLAHAGARRPRRRRRRRAADTAARADQLRVATRSRIAARAASASSPVAVRRSSVPPFAPRASTDRRLFASASRLARRDLDARRRSPSRSARSPQRVGRGGPRPSGSATTTRLRACLRHARPPPT